MPAAPTVTGAEKLSRSGASAHTLAAGAGKRLMIVTCDGVAGAVPAEPPSLVPPLAVPAPPPRSFAPPAVPAVPAVEEPPSPPLLDEPLLLLEHEHTSTEHKPRVAA